MQEIKLFGFGNHIFYFCRAHVKLIDNMKESSKKIAQKLLEINAIKLNMDAPYTWASGWKSPIYCDNRLSLSYPEIRSYIRDQIVSTIKEIFSEVEAIAGVATAGIPQGALVADALQIPFLYVRSKAKGHGMENKIEGKVTPGQKVVVIEDLVSTGGSSLHAIKALRKSKMKVLGMISIFTYGFPVAEANFKEEKVTLVSLSNYDDLIYEALEQQYIDQDQIPGLRKWREDPANWGR